ncbi:hypothetical protein [Lacticaseibacillus mingshuiensis]|uniref:Uncharacterized protein n=1 Tax=Lacticaseibacillus mingshuiensis TaxID=2799574 RepID=A0ABW4CJR0_9LACO
MAEPLIAVDPQPVADESEPIFGNKKRRAEKYFLHGRRQFTSNLFTSDPVSAQKRRLRIRGRP